MPNLPFCQHNLLGTFLCRLCVLWNIGTIYRLEDCTTPIASNIDIIYQQNCAKQSTLYKMNKNRHIITQFFFRIHIFSKTNVFFLCIC